MFIGVVSQQRCEDVLSRSQAECALLYNEPGAAIPEAVNVTAILDGFGDYAFIAHRLVTQMGAKQWALITGNH
jgi:hypothetical protein